MGNYAEILQNLEAAKASIAKAQTAITATQATIRQLISWCLTLTLLLVVALAVAFYLYMTP